MEETGMFSDQEGLWQQRVTSLQWQLPQRSWNGVGDIHCWFCRNLSQSWPNYGVYGENIVQSPL